MTRLNQIKLKPFFFLLAVLFSSLSLYCCQGNALNEDDYISQVMIDPFSNVGEFNPLLLGNNIQWTTKGDGLYCTINNTFDLKTIRTIMRLPLPVLRFPGGAMAGSYDWELGVGPELFRGQGPDYSGKMEFMHLGTAEFIKLLKITGAQGMITLNLNDAPEKSGAWLKHVNSMQEAMVHYWEIGNEPYFIQDPAYLTAREYSKRALEIDKTLKLIDANIATGATLQIGLEELSWIETLVPEAASWNETVISETKDSINFFSVHFYAPYYSDNSRDVSVKAMLAGPAHFEPALRKLRFQLAGFSQEKEIWVTEYNVLTDNDQANWKYGTSISQVSFITQMIMAFIRQGVAGANYWSLIGNHNFGMIKDAEQRLFRPAGMLFIHLAQLTESIALKTLIEAPKLTIPPVGNVEKLGRIMTLDALALKKDGEIWLLLVNRNPKDSVKLQLKLMADLEITAWQGCLFSAPDILSNFEELEYRPTRFKGLGSELSLPGAATAILRLIVK